MLWATMGGYGALALAALVILKQPAWQFSYPDVAYWAVAFTVPVAQHACRKQGYDISGSSASPSATRRLAVHLGVPALLWVLVQSLRVA